MKQVEAGSPYPGTRYFSALEQLLKIFVPYNSSVQLCAISKSDTMAQPVEM
ncbi:hypothetical protein OOU_Y34scaffold00428g6 [Pyricularia oryzae Y34]|uniref:Uncharacterized protein n=2 Tax=Pyricularia oryzae TaxID=318829 RepID=A0AA97P1T8_PYRO3|nr:hypothetical protein OOU_Y34scaffold00428g6 [Pyricularia oryzae Y34]